jgi:hypothetical protein
MSLLASEGLLQKDAEGKGRKRQRRKQETERHMHGKEPTQQHRLTQSNAEAENTAQEHNPTEKQKNNNHT